MRIAMQLQTSRQTRKAASRTMQIQHPLHRSFTPQIHNIFEICNMFDLVSPGGFDFSSRSKAQDPRGAGCGM
jgi:hypothetical protein